VQLSQAGAAFIASWEAIYLEAYPDPGTKGEPITIGIGATAATGLIRPRLGDIIPMNKALSLFEQSMRRYESAVNAAITLSLNQAQFDALVSFHYNTGAIKVGSVDDRLNAGRVTDALATLARYTRSGGREMSGLADRRRMEAALFRTGVYPRRKILVKDRVRSAGRLLDPSQFAWR
jgi:lysozyme